MYRIFAKIIMRLSRFPIIRFFIALYDVHYYYSLCQSHWQSNDLKNRLYIPSVDTRFKGLIKRGLDYHHHFSCRADLESQNYGHDFILKRFSKLTFYGGFNYVVEHGVIIEKEHDLNLKIRGLRSDYSHKKVITYGRKRTFELQSASVDGTSIGPYINYAKIPISDYSLNEMKAELGSVLLYFPVVFRNDNMEKLGIEMHKSIADQLIAQINFKTVIICYFWYDIKHYKNQLAPYNSVPHLRASCGDISNPYFLDHLRMLLSISTVIMSNLVNTPLLYAAFLKIQYALIGSKEVLKSLYSDTLLFNLINDIVVDDSLNLTNHSSNVFDEFLRKNYDFDKTFSSENLMELLNNRYPQ